MTALPEGWEWATVEELATPAGITDGPFGSNLKTEHYTTSGPRVVRLQNIGDGRFNDEKAHISPEHYSRLTKHSVEAGDVLVASLGEELPRACVAPVSLGPAIVKADCIRIRPGAGIVSAYLMAALNSPDVRSRVGGSIKGVGRPRVNLGDLRELQLPIAPTAEQERIVEAVEEAFSKLEAGEAGLRTVRRLTKRMRDAILAAAYAGRLVPQDPSDTPATQLLADLGVEVSTSAEDLPSGWCRARLDELIGPHGLFVDGDWVESKDQDPDGDVRLTQLADIGVGSWRNRSSRFMTADASNRLGCTLLEPGDVLVARMPEPLGRACQFPGDERPCVTVVDVAIVRPDKRSVDRIWLMWTINSPITRTEIESMKAGTTRKRISRKNLASITLPIPPLDEQHRIVGEVERQFSFLDACDQAVDAGTARSAAMRRAVLKSAFEGKLTFQDQTDEPASALLARIRTSRLATKPARRARRTA